MIRTILVVALVAFFAQVPMAAALTRIAPPPVTIDPVDDHPSGKPALTGKDKAMAVQAEKGDRALPNGMTLTTRDGKPGHQVIKGGGIAIPPPGPTPDPLPLPDPIPVPGDVVHQPSGGLPTAGPGPVEPTRRVIE